MSATRSFAVWERFSNLERKRFWFLVSRFWFLVGCALLRDPGLGDANDVDAFPRRGGLPRDSGLHFPTTWTYSLRRLGRAPARSGVDVSKRLSGSCNPASLGASGSRVHLCWTCKPGSRGSAPLPAQEHVYVVWNMHVRIARERVPTRNEKPETRNEKRFSTGSCACAL